MTDYTTVIVLTVVGFALLAFLLLAPVYFFLQREEQASEKLTADEIARRRSEEPLYPSGPPEEVRDSE